MRIVRTKLSSPREGETWEGERPREPYPREPIPVRHHPSKNSVRTIGFRSTILFVTVCTEGRMPILACQDMASIIVSAWAAADNWIVGQYVIMPDHVHFFCSPTTYPPCDFHRWMKQWKSLATIAWRKRGGPQFIAAGNTANSGNKDAINCVPPIIAAGNTANSDNKDAINCVPPRRLPPLFQRNCWDEQLRTGFQYKEKWEYVRNNPTRKGLVANADDWPYQGWMNVLEWHEGM